MAHEVPPLRYDYEALEPTIDAPTMRLHYDKHHRAYVDTANAALECTGLDGKPSRRSWVRSISFPPTGRSRFATMAVDMPTTARSGSRRARMGEENLAREPSQLAGDIAQDVKNWNRGVDGRHRRRDRPVTMRSDAQGSKF
ncbi:MAG: hypothetical protein JO286_12750 [Solirubrobacterales bacterium]|nr:hypothetical protein [Solirubrobacterales bacterium]